jgi:hypothetical protein
MKVIFLDHDGVICLLPNWGSRQKKLENVIDKKTASADIKFDDFYPDAVTVLNRILSKTDAEIVISSDWKLYAPLEDIQEMYLERGVIKAPIGYTDELNHSWIDEGFVPEWFNFQMPKAYEMARYYEITKWLNDHQEAVTHWVAIDDMDLMKEYNQPNDTKDFEINRPEDGKIIRDWGLTNFVWTPDVMTGITGAGVETEIIKFLT